MKTAPGRFSICIDRLSMIRIPCPHCGLRDHSEFTYLGDATVTRPDDTDTEDRGRGGRWSRYLYQRDNPRGVHQELWHHGQGCRSWLVVTRNTASHEVLGAKLARDRSARS
jgi:sarcosine oxidase subunit delta